jgi:hypothetical protein
LQTHVTFDESGIRLFSWPVKEINSLVGKTHAFNDVQLKVGDDLLKEVGPLDLIDMEIDFDPGTAEKVVFDFAGVRLTYDAEARMLSQTGVRDDGQLENVTVFKNLTPQKGAVKLRFLIHRLSVETYAFHGERFFAGYYSPKHDDGKQSIHVFGGRSKNKRIYYS